MLCLLVLGFQALVVAVCLAWTINLQYLFHPHKESRLRSQDIGVGGELGVLDFSCSFLNSTSHPLSQPLLLIPQVKTQASDQDSQEVGTLPGSTVTSWVACFLALFLEVPGHTHAT